MRHAGNESVMRRKNMTGTQPDRQTCRHTIRRTCTLKAHNQARTHHRQTHNHQANKDQTDTQSRTTSIMHAHMATSGTQSARTAAVVTRCAGRHQLLSQSERLISSLDAFYRQPHK